MLVLPKKVDPQLGWLLYGLDNVGGPETLQAAAQHLLPFCSTQPAALCHTFLLPLLLQLAADKVWTVRKALAVTLAGLLQLTCRTATATPESPEGTDAQV